MSNNMLLILPWYFVCIHTSEPSVMSPLPACGTFMAAIQPPFGQAYSEPSMMIHLSSCGWVLHTESLSLLGFSSNTKLWIGS